jgi:hypothetical protein
MTAAHWLRQPGFGAGLTDFEAYASSDPNFQAAWGEVQAQLNVEGAGTTQLNSAKTAFVNSFEQIAGQGFSSSDPIGAAKAYVMTGQTILGAVNTVTSLVSSIQNAPAQAIQDFTGVMVGLAGATLSAGIGAAIVVGVEIALSVMQSAGLFPPPSHCDYPVGSLCATSTNSVRVPPGSGAWRRFPDSTNPNDAVWFQPNPPQAWGWNDLILFKPTFGTTERPIDQGFPNYNMIEAMASRGDAFEQAFASAWKGNQAFLLNGLQPQPDYQVLIHALRLWNRTHAGPMHTVQVMYVITSPYLFSLTTDAYTFAGDGDGIKMNGTVGMNTGALIVPPVAPVAPLAPHHVISLHIQHGAITAPAPVVPTTSGLSTGAKVAVGGAAVTGAALLGAVAYGYLKGEAVDAVLKGAWRHVKGWF